MEKNISKARYLYIYSDRLDELAATRVFTQCQDVIEIELLSGNQRRRRRAQLSWRTVVNELRKRGSRTLNTQESEQ
jgi:hypothetical protein